MVNIVSIVLDSSNPSEGISEEREIEEDKGINIQNGIGNLENASSVGT